MRINHVLVRTTDLNAMTIFWTELIGLKAGHRPPFPRPGVWLYSDRQPLIHLVEVERVDAGGSLDHVALEGADFASLIARLQQHNASFRETVVPGSNDRISVDGDIENGVPTTAEKGELPGDAPSNEVTTTNLVYSNDEFLQQKLRGRLSCRTSRAHTAAAPLPPSRTPLTGTRFSISRRTPQRSTESKSPW